MDFDLVEQMKEFPQFYFQKYRFVRLFIDQRFNFRNADDYFLYLVNGEFLFRLFYSFYLEVKF